MPDYSIAELEAATGLFRYTRNSFSSAGQASYDTPPTQDPDAFEVMTNTLPVVTDQLQRRWGTLPLCTTVGQSLRMAEYRVTANTTRGIVVSDSNSAYLYDEATFLPILAPVFTYQNAPNLPRFLTSRSYLYTGNGGDMLKSKGVVGAVQQAWGIQMTGVTATAYGPNHPTFIPNPDGGWTNPLDGLTQNGVYTYTTNLVDQQVLEMGKYGFTVPPDLQINGIQVTVYGYTTCATPITGGIVLQKSGGAQLPARTIQMPVTAGAHTVIGSPTDLWGTSWVAPDFGDVAGNGGKGFELLFYCYHTTKGDLTPGIVEIDTITITLFYNAAFSTTTGGAGNITLTGGRRYCIVYKNNANNHLSDLSAPTTTTGPLTNKTVILQNLPISPDPQVTNKVLLATADGGDITKFYELATIDPGVTTYTDNIPETVLLLQNVYLETDSYGIEHGCSGNTPPPPANVFIKHLGRVYFLVDSTLYFSKNEDEMTTSTGLICGRYEESVPGDYQMDISSQAEIGSTLFSDGTTLYIATEKQIRRLYGDGPTNFQTPQIHFTEVGVMAPELLQTVYIEGRPSGVVWLTPDLKVIGSDFLFYQNIGKPIQDVLNTINPDAVRLVAQSQFFAQGAFQFVIFGVPTGTNSFIDTVLVYDLVRKKWHVWSFPAAININSFLTNITANGTPRLLMGGLIINGGSAPQQQTDLRFRPPPFQYINYLWQISPAMVIDQISGPGAPPDQFNSVPITASIRSTWQTFGDVNLRKDFDEIEVFTKDPNLTLTLEGASNSNEFSTPVPIFSNLPLRVSAFGEYKWYMAAQPTVDRFYRFTYTSTYNDRSFIDGYRMDIIPEHRF